MTRIPFASWSQSRSIVVALAATSVACSDGPTRPSPNPLILQPSSNVLSIGDVRRATPQTPCKTGPHRQFDFWLGEAVVNTSGVFDGVNDVTSELDGCLVAEHWYDAGQVKGWSLNMYDPTTGLWYQHWVDEFGVNLLLSGGLKDGSMVIEGTRPRPAGGFVYDRITYTPLPGRHMRQLWEQSINNGPISVSFDGIYDPQPGAEKPPAPGTTACAGPAYHTADFLVGRWRVEAPNGLEIGQSTITAELSTCLLLEELSTPKGYKAKAFLSWGRAAQRWNRTYVDSEAHRIFVSGIVAPDGSLVLTGSVAVENGERVMTRVTWSKKANGNLEQLWEVSRDDGATWTVDETLLYVPA
jgi:hypothetical protein